MKFKSLAIGCRFEFVDGPSVKRGPWVKVSARKYVKVGVQHPREFQVVSVNTEVRYV